MIIRVTRKARQLYYDRSHLPATVQWARRIYSMATLNRHCIDHPTARTLSSVISWKDTIWWEKEKAAGNQADRSNVTAWRHESSQGRRLATWDTVLWKVYGDEWKSVSGLNHGDLMNASKVLLRAEQWIAEQ